MYNPFKHKMLTVINCTYFASEFYIHVFIQYFEIFFTNIYPQSQFLSFLRYVIYCVTDEMQSKYIRVKSAVTKVYDGDHFESQGNYTKAMQCYKDAIEILIPVVEGIYNIHVS